MHYFESVGAKGTCPCCGQNNWLSTRAPHDLVFAYVATKADGGLLVNPPSIPVTVLICENCHFVRQHALKPLVHKIQTQKASTKADDEPRA